MNKKAYIITGAIVGLVYSIFSNQNIISAIIVIGIGAMLGKSKWLTKEMQDKGKDKAYDKLQEGRNKRYSGVD